jgi:pimeloyl-ACP methyl ester carboxylesterase
MWTFRYFSKPKELNEAARYSAPGSFVALSDGWTHYELGGTRPHPQPLSRKRERGVNPPPPSGEGLGVRANVVLVHGFSVPYFIWDPTFDFLAAHGFRVLRYDLFGRGYSDRPKLRYDIDLFCKQLRELTDTLGLERFHLVGLSLGGPISATFTARYPERVQKLALIDPAGAQRISPWSVIRESIAYRVAGALRGLPGRKRVGGDAEFEFYDAIRDRSFVEKYTVQLQYKGFLRALLSTIRNDMLADFTGTYRKVGELGIPTLLFWGRNDQTVPFAHSDLIRAAIPQIEFHTFERCGHIPQYEKAEEANPLLLEFLR